MIQCFSCELMSDGRCTHCLMGDNGCDMTIISRCPKENICDFLISKEEYDSILKGGKSVKVEKTEEFAKQYLTCYGRRNHLGWCDRLECGRIIFEHPTCLQMGAFKYPYLNLTDGSRNIIVRVGGIFTKPDEPYNIEIEIN